MLAQRKETKESAVFIGLAFYKGASFYGVHEFTFNNTKGFRLLLSVLRNNERRSGSVKRSLTHAALKMNDAKQFPIYRFDFLDAFLSRKKY